MSPDDKAFINKWKDIVDVVEIKAESVVDGTVRGLVAQGWEVNNVLKGLVSLVKRGSPALSVPEPGVDVELKEEHYEEDPQPLTCERGVHEPLKADVLACTNCTFIKIAPEVKPECTWDGWLCLKSTDTTSTTRTSTKSFTATSSPRISCLHPPMRFGLRISV